VGHPFKPLFLTERIFIRASGIVEPETKMKKEAIAVLDFGGQYAHLIATKVRALGVYAEILEPEENIEKLLEYKGIILSGSPALSSEDEEDAYNKKIFDHDIPILGFCFGHQEIAKRYGGKVEHKAREYGKAALRISGGSPIFDGLEKEETVWMSHGDTVVSIGGELHEIGKSFTGGVEHHYAAIASDELKRYGFQFHPEVDDTINGQKMLYNFAVKILASPPRGRWAHTRKSSSGRSGKRRPEEASSFSRREASIRPSARRFSSRRSAPKKSAFST